MVLIAIVDQFYGINKIKIMFTLIKSRNCLVFITTISHLKKNSQNDQRLLLRLFGRMTLKIIDLNLKFIGNEKNYNNVHI